MDEHTNAYAYCENMCKVDTYVKENYVILEGQGTVQSSTTGFSEEFSFPKGFTKDNTVVIGAQTQLVDSLTEQPWIYNNDIIKVNLANFDETKIGVDITAEAETTYNFKVVLFRYK